MLPHSPRSSLCNLPRTKNKPMKGVILYCKNCGNGSPVCALRQCRHCRDRPSADRSTEGPSSASALGKRAASTQTDMDPAPKRPSVASSVVVDSVAVCMTNFYRQDNEALNQALRDAQLENARLSRALALSTRRANMFAQQVGNVYSYCNMLETWIPAIDVMFNGDYAEMRRIHADQIAMLDELELQQEVADLTTEEEETEEE